MRPYDIPDNEIPTADPAAVIEQDTPYIKYLAKRYESVVARSGVVGMDDLIQVGRIAVSEAQKKYQPGNYSFIQILFYDIRRRMREELKINPNTGTAPDQLVYLDAPVSYSEEDAATLGELIPDPDAVSPDEPIIKEETQRETSAAVHAAVDRLKNEKQREVIRRLYLEDQTRSQAAEEMGLQYPNLCAIDHAARSKLRRDKWLRAFVFPQFNVSIGSFKHTFTSAVEKAILWREQMYDDHYGEGAYAQWKAK